MAQTSWRNCLGLMDSLTRTLEELTQVEREKNDAASRGDLAGVEACMKREQVLSLTLRGCDQKRDSVLSDLGLETKAAVEELRRQYELFQAASEVTRDTLEVNLRAIERIQAARAGDSAEAAERRKNHQTDFRA